MALKRLTLLLCVTCVFLNEQMASKDVIPRRQYRSLPSSAFQTTDPPKFKPVEASIGMDIKHLRKGVDALLSWRGTAINYFHHLKTQLHVVVSRVEEAFERIDNVNTENVVPRRDYILEAMAGHLLQTNARLEKLEKELQGVSSGIEELRDQKLLQEKEYRAKQEEKTTVYPRDCQGVVASGHKESGVYIIQPSHYPYSSKQHGTLMEPFYVYCRMDIDGGWTVMQRRADNTTDFYRTWQEYRRGFGSPLGEYWLGNDRIHLLTSQGRYKLRVYMENWEGESSYADYDRVIVEDEAGKYRLRLGEYSGTAGDSLLYHRDQPFSTWDRDNDARSGNCAEMCKGAWWYRSCQQSNLNGLYLYSKQNHMDEGVDWKTWTGHNDTLMFVEMSLLPIDSFENFEMLYIK